MSADTKLIAEQTIEIVQLRLEVERLRPMSSEWRPIGTLPPPGERPGKVWVIVEGHQHHSGMGWYRQMAGLARTHNEGFDEADIRRIEADDHMDPGSGRVTHWLPIELPKYPSTRQQ